MVHSSSSNDGSGALAMRVSGLALKFWMMTSCRWPCARCRSRSASSASIRSSRVSPMPIRMPEVKGTFALPAASSVASRSAGTLSGAPIVGTAALAQPLGRAFEHDAHRDRRLAQAREVGRVHQAGIEVRQQAGLLEDQRAHRREIVERRGIAHRRQRLGGGLPLQLGLVAQGEQRLGAAGRLARARDLEHLLGREIGRLAAPRRMHEGAVAAGVAAEMGQRNEHLLGEGDAIAERRVAHGRRLAHQRSEIAGEEIRRHGERPGTRDDRKRELSDRPAYRCRAQGPDGE